MKYESIVEGRFESRPNRFIAYVNMNGTREKVHVKNTGRCRELLTDGAEVFLSESSNPERSTRYDLVTVRKGERLVNMDSQAPNKAVEEWLLKKEFFPDITCVRPETTYGNSRFDFYIETKRDKIFMEVKGVTLEQDNMVLFPDAPSERAVKHVYELIEAVKDGYQAYIMFVVQMKNVSLFMPNRDTQPEFADALLAAREAGVKIIAYDCLVTQDSMVIDAPVPVALSPLDRIAEPLLSWYDRGRRILPWREEPTPYHVWVSEIMLQQTRVEAVKPYYDRFMKSLPGIETLSKAPEEVLLKLWEGLGYYNRVRNLNKAAVKVMEEYGGIMPDSYEELLTLPGIGSYTAGAIASIAYGKPVPAVDGNVLRVLSRLRCDDRDIMQQTVKKQVEEELLTVMPKDRPGDFNQALMELGAMVCIPNGEPRCRECPWEDICMAHKQGTELQFPVKTRKKPRTIEKKTILIIRDENKAALRKRPDKGLLAGMYEFPNIEGHLSEKEVLKWLKERGLSVLRIEPLTESKHIFTHKEWHMIGYSVRVDELDRGEDLTDFIFVDQREAKEKYPIPSAYSAYLKAFYEKGGFSL
ncbi:MAG: A/G-specific adenine glycosylase [Lachnospiraceae bacterium]|nr:A/G-specific adenine glycosylase [Lachnospiraceae bacterium]